MFKNYQRGTHITRGVLGMNVQSANVDGTFYYCMRSCEDAAQGYRQGLQNHDDDLIDRWSDRLVGQIRKLNEGNLLSLVNMPQA